MKIQSNFKDYYDGVQALGHDDSLRYLRIREDFSLAHKGGDAAKIALQAQIEHRMPDVRNKFQRDSWTRIILGVCGKLYLGLRLKITGTAETKYKDTYKYFYTTDSLRKHFPDLENETPGYRPYWWSNDSRSFPELGLYDDACDDIFVALASPVFLLDTDGGWGKDHWDRDIRVSILSTNVNLKSLEFYKVLTDYEIYQELEMYLGNVLVGSRMNEAPLSDIQKVVNHGFDEKYGFRKRKQE